MDGLAKGQEEVQGCLEIKGRLWAWLWLRGEEKSHGRESVQVFPSAKWVRLQTTLVLEMMKCALQCCCVTGVTRAVPRAFPSCFTLVY